MLEKCVPANMHGPVYSVKIIWVMAGITIQPALQLPNDHLYQMSNGPRVELHVSYIADACKIHDQALKTEPEA